MGLPVSCYRPRRKPDRAMLSEHRDIAAAKAFFRWLLKSKPRMITSSS